jgi:uncharacterized protein YjbJ (UPF0337 family)
LGLTPDRSFTRPGLINDARKVWHQYRVAHIIGEIHMDANQNITQGQWLQLKGQAKQQWSKLTVEDIWQITANRNVFARILQQRYGYGKVQAEMEIDKWVHGYDQAHIDVLTRVNEKLLGASCLKINP